MAGNRKVEIFSAGCPVCGETIELVHRIACPSCEIEVHDMSSKDVVARARRLGVRSVPAIAVDGELVACCDGRGPDQGALQAAGIGKPL